MELKKDFLNRVEEVEIYFAFVEEFDSIETHKQKEIKINDFTQLTVKRDLQKVIRANCYLLLYNLIESTIRNGIWAIFDVIQDDKVSYKNLSNQIQNIWLTQKACEINECSNQTSIKKHIETIIYDQMSGEGVEFSRKRVSISGNLDYKTIEQLIKNYGFFGKIREKEKEKLSRAMLKIKNERNGLAHGNKSFRQSAEIVTIQELVNYKDLVVSYLNDITDNIVSYIQAKAYLKS